MNDQAVCSCLPNFVGSPPGCRPECVVSFECPQNQACVNQKCVDPCSQRPCGQNTRCQVVNHSPICTCLGGYTGNPFTLCQLIPRKNLLIRIALFMLTNSILAPKLDEPVVTNPCIPSPCGPNSQCREIGDSPSCSCLSGFLGSPPQCRPECVINQECASNLACIQQKCRDPCPGSCGSGALCTVINHNAICTCPGGYTGDPFTYCTLKPPSMHFRKSCRPIYVNLTTHYSSCDC